MASNRWSVASLRGVLAGAVLLTLSGCSLKYTYMPGAPLFETPPLPGPLLVTRLKDQTDKKYSKNLNSVENPVGSLSRALAASLEDRRLVDRVVYVNEEFRVEDLDMLRRRYGHFSGILTGAVENFKWNDYPYVSSFLPPFWIGAAFGIPIEHGGHALGLTFSTELLDLNGESLVWRGQFDRHLKMTRWGSLFTDIPAQLSDSLTQHMDTGIAAILEQLRGDAPKVALALRSPPAERLAVTAVPSPADTPVGFPVPPPGRVPAHVAVWQLKPLQGVEQSVAETLTENIRVVLVESGWFRVIARGEMERVMKEQAISLSAACDNTDCAVEYGKALSAEHIVVGTVAKVGNAWTIEAKRIDVGKGLVEKAGQDHASGGEEVLLDLARKVAGKLIQ